MRLSLRTYLVALSAIGASGMCLAQPPAVGSGIPAVVVQMEAPRKSIARVEVQVDAESSHEDSLGAVGLLLKILNHSPDTVRYVSMSCSQEDMFEIDQGMPYRIVPADCDKNAPCVRTLKPHTITFVKLWIASVTGTRPTKAFAAKVGFWFVDADLHGDVIDAYKNRRTMGTLLWSDPNYEDFNHR